MSEESFLIDMVQALREPNPDVVLLKRPLLRQVELTERMRVNLNKTIVQTQELTRRVNKLEAGF